MREPFHATRNAAVSRLVRGATISAIALAFAGHGSMAQSFDEQRKVVSASIESQSEEAILSLLESGIEEGKPTQAIAEARKWLRQNLPKNPMLNFHVGRAAELSGDASGAAALYQQYLKEADPQAEATGQAVIAMHTLLRDQLKDVSAAYSANKSIGNRLAGNPMVRQFDQWFLNEARNRQDVIAVANRLHALIKAGLPDDLRSTFYDDHYRWLLDQVDVYVEQPGSVPITKEVVEAYKQLADAMTFNEELALKLDWAVSVRAYNLARISEEDASPPLAEAKALLAKFPRYAQWVQTGWAGGGNGQHYRNDPTKYWPHEIEAKLAPVIEAAPKLTPLELGDLIQSWRDGYYSDRVVRPLQIKPVAAYVSANPKLMNSRLGVIVTDKEWNQLTPAEALALAPDLSEIALPEASLIRSVAAGGEEKDLNKMIAALTGPEAWRLGLAELDGRYADQLWHYAGRPGDSANRDQKIEQSKKLAQQLKSAGLDVNANANQRLGLFRKLWADYRSKQPKIPGVVEQLKAIVRITPEAIPELLKDDSPEAQMLARDAIVAGVTGADPVWKELEAANKVSVTAYSPGILYLAARHAGRSLEELKKRRPQACVAHPLEADLRKSVEEGLKKNNLQAWQVLAWINMQYPEDNEEQIKLMQSVMGSPMWKSMPFEVHFAALEWFGKSVMTPGQKAWVDAADPTLVCKDLLALVEEEKPAEKGKKKDVEELDDAAKAAIAAEDVNKAVAALESTVDGVKKSPVRISIPDRALENLAALDPAVFADAKAMELILQLIDYYKTAGPTDNFGRRVLAAVQNNPDPLVLHRVAPFLWEQVNRNHRVFAEVKQLTHSLVSEHPSAASALANAGLDAIARHRGHTYYKREVDIPQLKSTIGNAAMAMGLIVIPVPKNDEAYPIYQAQGDWVTGNEDSAWTLLDENWDAFLPVYRELSVPFVLWTLERTIYGRDESRQENLIKALLAWAEEDGSPLSLTEKAQIEIAYGDIAMQLGQLGQAHEIYTRVQNKEAYQELPIRYQAALRRVKAERVAQNYDGALKTIAEIELDRVPEIWEQTRYARAMVYYDMEQYEDAKDDIDSILARNPEQADAKILLGKVQLKRQKLMEATEVELGTAASQKSLVPGERLKVTLVDPTLAVSGAGTEIEVVVWATSGDKETFFLRQFGDSKTKFRGEVETALGAPTPGDDTLQVIGDDEVFYAYSERFREKMNGLEEKRGGPIIVASDAILMASARKLLSEAEQRTADMEAVMESIRGGATEGATKAAMAARSMSAEARAEEDGFSEAEFERFVTNVAKPGNPIHVRVIDPDRSRTAEIDELNISVATSSGDTVSRVTLKETGTHTGWFEGSIPTTGAQALAFSQNSEPGRNPNMVISPQAGSYPAWRPVAAEGTVPQFVVDLNDNVAIGELKIVANESGAALKNFYLQTGMNEGDMTTVAAYPRNQAAVEKPWHPSVVVMNDTDHHHNRNERSVYDLGELRHQMERGWMTQNYAAAAAGNVAGPSEAMTESIPGQVEWLRQNRHHNSHVIYRFRGYFHEEDQVTRRFKLELGNYQVPEKTHSSVAHPPQFLLAVDGRPITNAKNPGRLEGEVNLRPGLHYFEIWATGWDCTIGFGRSVKLRANLENNDELVEVPDAFFDPSTFPEDVLVHRNSPAQISANDDGTEFTVKFGGNSRTRLLKLVFLDQEGAVPALNELILKGPEGEGILPVAEDFASLNKNDTLEILTGDKIAVRYVDDRFVTKTKERHERSLEVAFTDAKVEFADMEPRFSSKHGEKKPYYEQLLRFQYDKPLSLAIHDADMDVSVEPDKVMVSLNSQAGGSREFEAVETGDSTGIFKLVVVPVGGQASGDNQIQVAAGGVITATYLDEENNRPGVPIERTTKISHAAFVQPEFRIAHAQVTPLETETTHSLIHGFQRRNYSPDGEDRLANERIRPRWKIDNVLLPASEAPADGFDLVHGRIAYFELIAPHLCLGTFSDVTVYAQTDSGRERAGFSGEGFDIKVPGTVALDATTGRAFNHTFPWRDVPQIEIYQGGGIQESSAPQYDRFKLSVPLVAGMPPLEGALTYDEIKQLSEDAKTSRRAADALDQIRRIRGLVVQPGERIHFGFQFTGPDGKQQWMTTSAKVVTHPAFDIMSEDYREPMTSAYVGETLNLRVVDLGADISDDSDRVNVLVQGKSGEKHLVELRESGPHTGIFKAEPELSYAQTVKQDSTGDDDEEYDVRSQGFPVIYGDTVAARYTDGNGVKSDVAMVTISKGADGSIQPFSKIYEDDEIATRTQFSLAEAYLEMAKRHRKLDQPEAAAIEYASAKQLLSKAMDEFTDPETRAHAEYLLGTLTMEEADATEDEETQEIRYRAALSRFLSVTGSYPQTIHASRAQYQIATLYERLKEPDIAAQEYVKLAYKYPDSEYLAVSMARLGSHFLKTAAAYEAKAKPLLEQEDDKDAQFEGTALQKMAVREYIKTAQIFGRLQERFPTDSLAGQAGLRAGQAYMRANKKQEAVDSFQRVIDEESYDGPKIRAQAMYWIGMCYQDLRQQMAAYSIFKRLTYDFPESKWASYARAQLSQESLLNLETKLELQRLEGER